MEHYVLALHDKSSLSALDDFLTGFNPDKSVIAAGSRQVSSLDPVPTPSDTEHPSRAQNPPTETSRARHDTTRHDIFPTATVPTDPTGSPGSTFALP